MRESKTLLGVKIPQIFICAAHVLIPKFEAFGTPLVDVAMRLWVANIFFTSGMLKLKSWDSTIMLFTYEHPVPLLSSEWAACMAVAGELVLPVMLVLGLGGRVAAFGLLIMTLVIELTYQHVDEHYVWAMLLFAIFFRGAGILSVDHVIRRKLLNV